MISYLPPEISLDPFFLRNFASCRKILKGLFSFDKLIPYVISPLLVSFKFWIEEVGEKENPKDKKQNKQFDKDNDP